MIFSLLRWRKAKRIDALYGAVMALARRPELYAEFGVADSVEGRLEMLMLHCGLVIRRLASEPAGQAASQALSEAFLADMQRSFRELGYDDSGLKRRLKAVTGALYGRAEAVGEALGSGKPDALVTVLERNVYGGPSPHAGRLAGHIAAFSRALEGLPVVEIAAGRLPLPPPSAIAADQISLSEP
jgi:cytochrome b pre-mRNA-processing protein 3